MKKRYLSVIATLLCALLAVFTVFGAGCKKNYDKNIEQEMKGSFNFFWNEAQTAESEYPTYGLILDRYPSGRGYASIASVGFGLAAYVVGAEEGYVTKDAAKERTEKTLDTLLTLQKKSGVAWNGFFAHFITTDKGERWGKCEISSVDTAILLCGALTAGEYFGGTVKEKADELYSNVNWTSFIKTRGRKSYISMAYNPDSGAVSDGCWDYYAEQLMIYVLGAGSPTEEYRLGDTEYYDFTRTKGEYGDSGEFYYSWFGSIFTYQFSHAFVDFRGKVDKDGTNWFQNSVNASKAAYNYCKSNTGSKTFKEGGWGLTACDAPLGYNGHLGNPPRGWTPTGDYLVYEGTVAPAGAIGSVVFIPDESLKALKYYQTLEELQGEYGLKDSYNLDCNYYAVDSIGIDKGISLLMLANYKGETVWKQFMKSTYVNSGLSVLGFKEA